MFCRNCGTKMADHMKFCPKCGTAVIRQSDQPEKSQEVQSEYSIQIPQDSTLQLNADSYDEKTEILQPVQIAPPEVHFEKEHNKERGGRKLLIVTLCIVLIVLVGVGIGYIFLSSNKKAEEYEQHIDLAGEYYDGKEYDEAVSVYKEAIRLLPQREEAYIGLADAYIAQEKTDSAITTLETAYEITESKKIKEKLAELTGQDLDKIIVEGQGSGEKVEGESKEIVENQIPANINIRQVDNTNFPNITFYATISDEDGNVIEGVDTSDFRVQEIDANGNVSEVQLKDVYRVLGSADGRINMNMVLDASGSMTDSNKMSQAKAAANSFLKKVNLNGGDRVEIISFDDYVYLEQEFVSNEAALNNAINNIEPWGSTALYDALYAGVFQTYYEEGAKCVVGFTDGMENASSYSFYDVVDLAQSTGIPVYIIGIGEEYDAATLKELAVKCGGEYYSANTNDLATILEEIYLDIYQEQQDYYVFEYTSVNTDNLNAYREISIATTETSEFAFTGEYKKEYVPIADLSGAFSAEYSNLDYMLPESSTREITDADLAGMSLAQLRIARNEIFARHGRLFKDSMLNQWFYSKTWYLNIPQKYAPDDFDANNRSPLSKLESDNINRIVAYENAIMSSQDIYPNASTVLLSEYDLGLSKTVLKRAYTQMLNYSSSDILTQNLQKVQDAINKEDVEY